MSDLSQMLAPTGASPMDLGIETASLGAPTGEGFSAVEPVGFTAGVHPVAISPQLITQQFQAIQRFNAVSQTPVLPEGVTLDFLANPELPDVRSMNDFLYGLEADLRAVDARIRAAAQAPASELVTPDSPAVFQAEDSFLNQGRRIANDIAGLPWKRPTVVPGDPSAAILDFKREAINRGLIDPETPLNGAWDPSMSNAWFDLQNEVTGEKLQGIDKVGAFSVADVGRFFDDWLSPTSLLSAAVAMDFLPNLDAVGKEWEQEGGLGGWLGNIRDYVDEPWNVGKLGKALGPIDDLVFPVLNTALLFSGVGSVVNFYRAGRAVRMLNGGLSGAALVGNQAGTAAAKQAIGAGRAFGSIGPKAIGAVDDVVRMNQPGLLATRLQKGNMLSRVPGATGLGQGMAAWRQAEAVQMGRFTVAQGMKTGALSMVQQQISPDRTLGLTIPGLGTAETHAARVEELKQWRTTGPLAPVAALFEPAFTPVSILRPGTLTGPLLGVNKTIRLRMLGLTRDQQVGAMVHSGIARHISRLPAPEQATYEGLKPMDKVVKYLAEVPGAATISDDDRLLAADKLTLALVSMGIDKQSEGIARALIANPQVKDSGIYQRMVFAVQSHLENRIRKFDLDNFDPTDYEQVRQAMALRSGMESQDLLTPSEFAILDPNVAEQLTDPEAVLKIRRSSVESMMAELADPKTGPVALARLKAELAHHEQLRLATLSDLLDNLDDVDVYQFFDSYGPSFRQNWNKWMDANDLVESLDMEFLGLTPVYASPEQAPFMPSMFGVELSKWIPTPLMSKAQNITDKTINHMQQASQARFKMPTLMKTDTPDRAQIGYIQEALYRFHEMATNVTQLGGRFDETMGATPELFIGSLYDYASRFNKRVEDLTQTEIVHWLDDLSQDVSVSLTDDQIAWLGGVVGGEVDETRGFVQSLQHFSRQGLGPEEVVGAINRRMDELNRSDFWKRIEAIDRWTLDVETATSRATTLDEKIKALRSIRDITGAEVEIPYEQAQMLAAKGYKVVVGDQFLQFKHLDGLRAPMEDITNRHLQKYSLGTFTTRQDHARINRLRAQLFEENLRDGVARLRNAGRWSGPESFEATPDDMNELMQVLASHHRAGLEAISKGEQLSGSGVTTMFNRMSRQGHAYSVYENATIKTLDKVLNSPEVVSALGGTWDKQSLKVLRGALLKSRNVGWEYRGLASVADRMASASWGKGLLKMMAYGDTAQQAGAFNRFKRTMGVGTHRDEADMYRAWKATGSAVLGAALGGVRGALSDEEGTMGNPWQMAALGAAGGALSGVGPGTATRTFGRGLAAFGTAEAASAAGLSDRNSLGLGVLAGTVGFAGFRKGATMGVDFLESRAMGEYAALFEPYERIRNQIRFSLSPIFDLQRYTEGWALAGLSTYKDADGVIHQIPGGLRPWKQVEKMGGNIDEAMTQFRHAAAGQEWHDALTWTDARLAEVGILGYSPTKAMAAVHYQLVDQGVEATEAVKMVKEIFQYGERARTGVEQSVNFVFFPFSFQKHYLSKIASFAAEDLGRAVMVHDAIKLYSMLEHEAGFHDIVNQHLPVLDQLRKFNSLAYGISPGQFGGINRPTWELLRATPLVGRATDMFLNGTVMAAMVPGGVRIESKASGEEFVQTMGQMIPFWRDGTDLWEDLVDQKYVATSPDNLRKREDSQAGWEDLNELRSARDAIAQQLGVSVNTMMNGDNFQYQRIQQWYLNEQRNLFDARPAFAESYEKAVRSGQRRQAEIRQRTLAPQATQAEIDDFIRTGRTTNHDLALIKFQNTLDQFEALNDQLGREQLPGEYQTTLRRLAVELSVLAPHFRVLYDRFYSRSLGPIEKEI